MQIFVNSEMSDDLNGVDTTLPLQVIAQTKDSYDGIDCKDSKLFYNFFHKSHD
jgi:hypothetical protein